MVGLPMSKKRNVGWSVTFKKKSNGDFLLHCRGGRSKLGLFGALFLVACLVLFYNLIDVSNIFKGVLM